MLQLIPSEYELVSNLTPTQQDIVKLGGIELFNFNREVFGCFDFDVPSRGYVQCILKTDIPV